MLETPRRPAPSFISAMRAFFFWSDVDFGENLGICAGGGAATDGIVVDDDDNVDKEGWIPMVGPRFRSNVRGMEDRS